MGSFAKRLIGNDDLKSRDIVTRQARRTLVPKTTPPRFWLANLSEIGEPRAALDRNRLLGEGGDRPTGRRRFRTSRQVGRIEGFAIEWIWSVGLAMIEVERATREDASVFAAMERAPDTREYIIPCTEAEHAQKLLDAGLVYLRILRDGELVGFFILGLDADGESIELRRVVVSAKGSGVGQLAMLAMEQFCRAEVGRPRIWLDVFENNHRGRHIYEKLGYERYGHGEHGGKRLLLYQKQL